MKCIHCQEVIPPTTEPFTYPKSRAKAHVGCVSQESIDAMDALILAQQTSSTRRVYTSRPRGAA